MVLYLFIEGGFSLICVFVYDKMIKSQIAFYFTYGYLKY